MLCTSHGHRSRFGGHRSLTGFTLIEMMIVVAVIAIIATIAVPAYRESVRKGGRADAVSRLAQLQQAQERWRADSASFALTLAELGLTATAANSPYTLAITEATATRFVATATATGSSQADDTVCRVLKLTSNGGNISYTSLNAGGSEDTSTSNRCWNR